MPCWKGSCCAFAMHPHVAEIGMRFALHEVMAYLVDDLQRFPKRLEKGLAHRFEQHESIDDSEVCPGRYCVEVAAIIRGLGCKETEIQIGNLLRLFALCAMEVV